MIRPLILLFLPLLLTGCEQSEMGSEAKAASTAVATGPIVVELFQSQGCSSCPPANAALNEIAGQNNIIALNFAVTYWDRLGWKDIFADPAYTQRQYDYASALHGDNVYTPQVILNGRLAIVGNRPGELRQATQKTAPVSGGPSIMGTERQVTIGGGKASIQGKASVWLVRYDPRVQNVAIKTGENGGRTLPHKNIVRQLTKLGSWNGNEVRFNLQPSPSTLWKSVILVQKNEAGPILSARVL